MRGNIRRSVHCVWPVLSHSPLSRALIAQRSATCVPSTSVTRIRVPSGTITPRPLWGATTKRLTARKDIPSGEAPVPHTIVVGAIQPSGACLAEAADVRRGGVRRLPVRPDDVATRVPLHLLDLIPELLRLRGIRLSLRLVEEVVVG